MLPNTKIHTLFFQSILSRHYPMVGKLSQTERQCVCLTWKHVLEALVREGRAVCKHNASHRQFVRLCQLVYNSRQTITPILREENEVEDQVEWSLRTLEWTVSPPRSRWNENSPLQLFSRPLPKPHESLSRPYP